MGVTNLEKFESESFDVVFDALCIHCIIGKDRPEMYKEISRVLKKGGLFYLNSSCGGSEHDQVKGFANFDKNTNCEIRDGKPYRYIGTEAELIKELKDHQFQMIRKEIIYRNGMIGNIKVLAKKIP